MIGKIQFDFYSTMSQPAANSGKIWRFIVRPKKGLNLDETRFNGQKV